jgi:nucleoid-associated protein YgaU
MSIPKGVYSKRLLLMLGLIQICIFAFGAVAEKTNETLDNIRTNRYLAESLRLHDLAKQALAAGDYDGAAANAENAAKAAAASDLYVRQQVKMYIANSKMDDALERLSWADSAEAKRHFPAEFYDAKTYYNLGLIAKGARKWDDTIDNADKVIKTLAAFTAPPEEANVIDRVPVADTGRTVERIGITEEPALPVTDGEKTDKGTPLPARYTVRSWDKYGDCFWNIAGRSWVYGDPRRWPLLYQANKNKLTNPKNPDLIEEGMIVDIPSVNGEERSGAWSPDAVYSPLKK